MIEDYQRWGFSEDEVSSDVNAPFRGIIIGLLIVVSLCAGIAAAVAVL